MMRCEKNACHPASGRAQLLLNEPRCFRLDAPRFRMSPPPSSFGVDLTRLSEPRFFFVGGRPLSGSRR